MWLMSHMSRWWGAGMRNLLLLVVMACGVEQSSNDPCATAVCGAGQRCSSPSGIAQCNTIPVTQVIDAGPTAEVDAGSAGGGAGGGTGGGGGGGVTAPVKVFVTLSYDFATCNAVACYDCRKAACVTTRELTEETFRTMRTGDLSGCVVTQTASDGYSVRCDNCTTTNSTCLLPGGSRRADVLIGCNNVPGTYRAQCGWWRP